MLNIRWPGISAIAIIILGAVAILAPADDPIPADGRPYVRMIECPEGKSAVFETNFPLYRPGAEAPLAIETELGKIEGITSVGVTNKYSGFITIGNFFVLRGVPKKAKEVIISFAPKK